MTPENDDKAVQFNKRAIKAVIGGTMIHFVIGTIYMWGSVNIYAASYLKHKGDPFLSKQLVQLVYPMAYTALGMMLPFGVFLSEKLGVRTVLTTCSFILPGAIFASSFMTNFYAFCALYGFVFGFSAGIAYMIPIKIAYKYFPHKKGLVSGIINSGYGLGSFMFGWIVFFLVNPHNEGVEANGYMPEHVSDRWPMTIQIVSCLYFFFMITGTRLIEPPTHEEVLETEALYLPASQSKKPQCPSLREGFRRRLLYACLFMATSLAGFGMLMTTSYKYYAFERNTPELKSDSYLTFVGSIAGLFVALSRLGWGYMMDCVRFKTLAITSLLIQMTLAHTVQFTTTSRVLYCVFVWGTASCFGGGFSMMPTLTTQIFGSDIGPQLYGVVFQGFIVASWLQFVLVKGLIHHFDYDQIFQIYTIVHVIGLIVACCVKFEIDWVRESRLSTKLLGEGDENNIPMIDMGKNEPETKSKRASQNNRRSSQRESAKQTQPQNTQAITNGGETRAPNE